MANITSWETWIQAQEAYMPELEYAKEIGSSLKKFETSFLSQKSQDTSIWSIRVDHAAQQPQERYVNFTQLYDILQENTAEPPSSEFFFIKRAFTRNNTAEVNEGAHKLQISPHEFRSLAEHFQLPGAFLFALSRFYLPDEEGLRLREIADGRCATFQWYFLPFRVQVSCTKNKQRHEFSPIDSNQMNPFHYLHLPDQKVDIQGSQIAVYMSQHSQTNRMTVISFNFLDGRWHKIIEEPQSRIAETIKHSNAAIDSITVCSVFLASVIRWWNNALHSVNEQLVAYEKRLQEEKNIEESRVGAFYSPITLGLHATAAHIYRYGTELDSLERTVSEMVANFANLQGQTNSSLMKIDIIKRRLRITTAAVKELEKKVKNILALVRLCLLLCLICRGLPVRQLFNRIQVSNERMLVTNGKAMNEILKGTQEESMLSRQITVRSQNISEEMKKDSMSMKIIAEVTMVFLPGATFAAVLAMPSITNAKGKFWLWIWIALTVSATLVVLGVYYRRQRQARNEWTKGRRLCDGLFRVWPLRRSHWPGF